MSRRKVQGLTRTGRQVSEDPDLEALLSNLSLEELEQLENEVVSAAPEPEEEARGEETRRQTAENNNNNIRDAKRDTRRLSQRERSLEGEPKKESRKQEYLRKMGLSQEGTDGGLQRSSSVSSERDEDSGRGQDRSTEDRGQDRSTEDRAPGPSRLRTRDGKDNGATTADTKEREKTNEDAKTTRDRRENRESGGHSSKTKDMISRLQKSDDVREKERKEDYKKRDDSKTKGLISKLQEKKEKDGSKEKDRKEDVRTRGRVSKMLEKQNQVQEVKAEDKKSKAEQKDHVDRQQERQKSPDASKRDVQVERESSKDKAGEKEEEEERDKEKDKEVEKEEEKRDKKKEKEVEKEIKRKDQTREKERKSVGEKESEERKGKGSNSDGPESPRRDGQGNCVAAKEEDEEEEEDSSMFDELMEQVSRDDPALTELNVNNSEVIRTKTLIQFAEALRGNSHVKALAFANCRADDHVAYAVAATLRHNTTLASVNLDSNHLTGKGIIALIHALQHNDRLTELRFHNQRHICGGKTEMEMTKALKDNRTLLKLGYHFELAGPRMTMTNILSRNMDRQRQRRLQEQRQAQANGGDKKGAALEVPKTGAGSLRGSPMPSPKQSPRHSPVPSPKLTPKRTSVGAPPPPPPPPGAGPPPPPPPPPPAPLLDMDSLKNSLTPVSRRKTEGKAAGRAGARDQLLASIRDSTAKTLKKVPVPKLLQ